MAKSIVITGCAGFLGSHATDVFLARGHKVFGVDCFTYAANKNNLLNAMKHKNFKMFYVDINNFSDIREICLDNKIDWIVNFAAETHVDNSITSCDTFIRTNFGGVKNLLEVCKLKKDLKLFHISTDEVYGCAYGDAHTEDDALDPRNPYSATKAAAEHLIRAYKNTYGVNYKIIRPTNNFGPRHHSEKFIPTILNCIKNNEKIPIYGTGQNIRDWLFVKDNVSMIEKLLNTGQINETYNICAENYWNNNELVKLILEHFGRDFDENSVSYIDDRKGHDYRYAITSDKIKALNVFEKSDFTTSLTETIVSYIRK